MRGILIRQRSPEIERPSRDEAGIDLVRESSPPYFRNLYAKSRADRFGLSFAAFAAIITDIQNQYVPSGSTSADIAAFHQSLHVEELALARSCALGIASAWEAFVSQYRHKLYGMARSIAKEESVARDLADSLYSDLFGTNRNLDGARVSKLASYMGRGSLDGWLRMVMAQSFVNRCRSERRLVSLDSSSGGGGEFGSSDAVVDTRLDERVDAATDAVLRNLKSEDRLILASYYLDGSTLAEIARMLGAHESTISRRLEKIRSSLRKRIVQELRRLGMDARAAEAALQTDVRELAVDVRKRLVQEKGSESVL